MLIFFSSFDSSEGLEKMEKEKQKQMDREKGIPSQGSTTEKLLIDKEIKSLVKNTRQEMVNMFPKYFLL